MQTSKSNTLHASWFTEKTDYKERNSKKKSTASGGTIEFQKHRVRKCFLITALKLMSQFQSKRQRREKASSTLFS